MEPIIQPVERNLIIEELTQDKFISHTRRGGNELYEITAFDSPHTMREIGRLREIAFRMSGGGTGKSIDVDSFDTDPHYPYKQLIVWDPKDKDILGGYRYILCGGIEPEKLATRELFSFSKKFEDEYLPFTIELGRSFVNSYFSEVSRRKKSIFSLDNLWDGLGALMVKYDNYRYFFGKATMYTSYNYKARNTLLNFLNNYFPDKEGLVTPINPIDFDINNTYYKELFKNLEYNEAYKVLINELKIYGEHIPPLINSYINLSPSMNVFGTAINEEFGGVEETGILIRMADIYPEKLDRHIKPMQFLLQAMANKVRPKWWKKPL